MKTRYIKKYKMGGNVTHTVHAKFIDSMSQ
jgi:hypothetical protein